MMGVAMVNWKRGLVASRRGLALYHTHRPATFDDLVGDTRDSASVVNRDTGQRMPETVRQATIQVCRTAFHWKSDLRGLFLDAGVPEGLYDRYDIEENPKAKIARFVLNELRALGPRGAAIERTIVEELCRWDRPHRDAPDQAQGRADLQELKRVATANQILVNPEKAAAQIRREQAEREHQRQERRLQQIGAVRDRFNELARTQPRTYAELQQRGYALETLLADLFDASDVQYRRPYRAPHEQIDGSFHFRGFTYLVEAKWEKQPPSFNDLVTFKAKVDGKLESVRGLFVAMSGFDENILDHLLHVARGSKNNLVLMDRDDLLTIFEGRMTLKDALTAKIDAAEQRGEHWHPLGR